MALLEVLAALPAGDDAARQPVPADPRRARQLARHAARVVHRLHPALPDQLYVDLLRAVRQARQAGGVVRQVRHLVVVRVPAKWLKQKTFKINKTNPCFVICRLAL